MSISQVLRDNIEENSSRSSGNDLYKLVGSRAVARALIGGLNIHMFVLCPINFFLNQVDFKRN